MNHATTALSLLCLLLCWAPRCRGSYEPVELAEISALHTVIFAVQHRNLDKLDEAFREVSTPGSPVYQQHWSREAVAALTSNPASTAHVLSFLSSLPALHAATPSLHGEYITARAPLSTWAALFNTTFHRCAETGTGRWMHRARPHSVTMPRELFPAHVALVYNVQFVGALHAKVCIYVLLTCVCVYLILCAT